MHFVDQDVVYTLTLITPALILLIWKVRQARRFFKVFVRAR